MIRVLYISDSLKQRFGVTSVIMNYISHFDYKKIQVDLLVLRDSEDVVVDKAKSLGANVYFMPNFTGLNIFEYRMFFKNFFQKNRFDIVHSHFNQIDGIVFPIARKNGVKKCISHSHNTKLSDNKLKAIRNRLMCWNIYSNADICAACSVAAGNALFGRRFENSAKKIIIHNAIECDKFSFSNSKREKIRNEFGINQNTILLGNIGSFKPQKNQLFLLDVFYELKKYNATCYKLLLVGDGEKREELEKKVNELKLQGDVIFTGVRKDVASILSAIDLFVLPSLYEGLPVIGIEAQASGVDCIFSDTITKETDLIGINYLSLDLGAEGWAKNIFESVCKRNANSQNILKEQGYDIRNESEKLIQQYNNFLGK